MIKITNGYFKNNETNNKDIILSNCNKEINKDIMSSNNIKTKSFYNEHIDKLENGEQKKKKEKKNYNVKEILNNKKVSLQDIEKIITYLNEKTGKQYKITTKQTQDLIGNWLKQDFTVEQFKEVIDKKVKEWQGTEMEQYLRPSTLFGDKFEEYYNTPIKMQGKIKTSYSSNKYQDNCANHDTSDNPNWKNMTKEEIEEYKQKNWAKDENGNFKKY